MKYFVFDKIIADIHIFIYITFDDTKNYFYCRLQFVVEIFRQEKVIIKLWELV